MLYKKNLIKDLVHSNFIMWMFFCIFPVSAYAYIDPGTGSLWLQYLIGGVASLYFFVKVYYGKIKARFFSKKKENSAEKSMNMEEETDHV